MPEKGDCQCKCTHLDSLDLNQSWPSSAIPYDATKPQWLYSSIY